MDLTLSYSPVLLVLSLLGAGLLTAWSYRRNRPPLSNGKSVLLGILRGLAFALALLILFGAVWHRFSTTDEEALVALLVDTSESMMLGSGGTPPADAAQSALLELPDDPRLRAYSFDSEISPLQDERWDSLGFDGDRTDIAAALKRIQSDFEGRNLAAVLLLSDGHVTSGRNPLYLADQYPVPIHTAVAGDSTTSRDVLLARVITNEIAYTGVPLPFRVGVTANGFEGQRTTVGVSGGSAESVALPADDREVSTELSVTPTRPGLHRFTVTVAPVSGEATSRNNTKTVAVRVLDQKRSVLVVAGAPGPDLGAFRSALDTNPNLEVTVRTQRGPGVFYEGGLPGSLDSFDLLVLLGYPGPASSAENAARLASAVANGLPIVFLLTSQTDLRALSDRFGDHLVLVPGTAALTGMNAQFALVQGAEEHPVFDGIPREAWSRLPPLTAPRSPWTLYPGARAVLASSPGQAPIAAVRESGGSRSAAFLGAESWRWNTLPEDLDQFASVYSNFVANLVQWTTARRDRRPVRVRPDRTLFGNRERITFTGQVYTEELTPIDDARISLSIQSEGRQSEQTTMRPLGNGRYVGEFAPQPAGTYSFRAEASLGGASLGTDAGSFGVGELALEHRSPGANPSLMRRLAFRSGGQAVEASQLAELLESLDTQGMLAGREHVTDSESPLISLPWLLALIVALLTGEWVLRKRWGLM